MRVFFSFIFIFLIFSFFPVFCNIDSGKSKSMVCASCHGSDGNSINKNWPKIAGQFSGYLSKQLLEYRKGNLGDRFDPIMFGITKNLSDDDILNLSIYFSSNDIKRNVSDLYDSDFYGRSLYFFGNINSNLAACASCHGSTGEGNELAGFPKLASQHSDYIVQQLYNYKENKRKNDPVGIMRDIASRMSDEQIKSVASYISKM